MKIRAKGIEMNYELSGEGECLVLIHGFSDNMNMWYNQVPELAKQCRVLTYDVRGFGQTERTRDRYSMELFADDLYELLRALDVKSACVLGYSMGGRIALEFALNHPEFMRGLIFANSGMGGAPSPEMEERRTMMMGVLEMGDIEIISEIMTVASFSPGFEERNPAAFRRYKDIKMQNDPSAYREIAQMMIEALAGAPDWSRLKCPVLIIAGERDGLMETGVAELMKDSISDAVLEKLPTGHAAAIETPEEFNQLVLDFMKGLQGP